MLCDLQKASILKRISAWILDMILICVLATGFAFLISRMTNYDGFTKSLQEDYQAYEEKYNIKIDIAYEEYQKLTEEELSRFQAAEAELTKDKEIAKLYSVVTSLTLVITSLGIFLSVFLLEFLVPLFLKDGQTVGKKIFGIGVMSAEGVRISSVALFIRSVLGKYTLEIMVPVLIAVMIFFGMIGIGGTLVLGALLILQIVLLIATKTNSAIHDVLSGTVTVDMASQMIFESKEELIARKKALAAERAARYDD